MTPVLWLLLGLVLGAAFLAGARAQADAETRVLAVGLVVAAAIYVVFALVGAEPVWMAIEAAGVVLFGAVAWIGLNRSLLWLAAGWALHPVWDAGLHLVGTGASFAPEGYVWICVSFDLLVAAYLAFWRWPARAAREAA